MTTLIGQHRGGCFRLNSVAPIDHSVSRYMVLPLPKSVFQLIRMVLSPSQEEAHEFLHVSRFSSCQ